VQYRSAVFFHDEKQRATAEHVKAELEASGGAELFTAVEPASTFYLAEDYHQKYILKHDRVFSKEIARIFGKDEGALIASTVAARLSGLTGGFAPKSLTSETLGQLGLSPEGEKHAADLLSGSERPALLCK
jgi:hypothetical protein